MNKKEQIIYAKSVKDRVREKGYLMGFFLSSIQISPSHWHFIKKGERKLTPENKNKIDDFLSK